ncbi:transporter substrate-binding domain-containing protein [Acidaminobacter sp. JC074]|uniref:transporter substrate-binding domain-containing protein n=1 Tax=Acidaminobacter sp. JC074 TaxID=2530199 RepID=UPI001F0F81A3|nr:transporter substrate-binding domain-containing protein [Acidaminobacter sp. JC074]MCH4888363.1 transporter substrate-binding domain-containing protein [Acidaminobacter sp. JC074]
MKKKSSILLIVIILFTITVFSYAYKTDTKGEVIIVAADINYPPYEYEENDQAVGFNIDLMKAVAKEMNLNIEIQTGVWKDIRHGLVNGDIDILSGMFSSPERDKEVDFTTTHVIVSHSIFVRDDSNIKTLEDAKDKTILVQNHDLMHDYLIENKITNDIIPLDTQENALLSLENGVGDLALLNKYQTYYLMKKNDITSVKAVGDDLQQRKLCFAVKEGNQDLQALLNEGLAIIKSTGQYDQIYDVWFGIYEKQQNLLTLYRFFLFIGLPLLLIIFASWLWTWTLRREVARKTNELQAINLELEDSISRIHRTQNQLIQNEKMAALGRMVAGITHEISTPLGIIRTAISTAEHRTKELNDSFTQNTLSKSQLTKFISGDQELLHIIMKNLLITIDHLESFKVVAVDQMHEKPRTLMIGTYLEEVLLNLKPRLKKTKHNVVLKYDENYTIYTYPGAISQIITNFVTNSLKYGLYDIESGNIKIRLSKEADNFVLIYSDDGHGIPSEDLDQIFEPFFTTGLDKGGSGIGLNIVYNLVTQTLNGTIECESEIDKGVTFKITFPITTQ